MAIAMLVQVPGLNQERYDLAFQDTNQSGPAAGLILHAAGPAEGGFWMIEVWDSQEAADAFYGSDQFQEVSQRRGVPRPTITTWPVHNLHQPTQPPPSLHSTEAHVLREVHCRAVGFDCDETFHAEADEELLRQVATHAHLAHGTTLTPDYEAEIRSKIRDVPASAP